MKNSLDGFELDLKRQQKESVNLAIGQRMLLNIGNGKEKRLGKKQTKPKPRELRESKR